MPRIQLSRGRWLLLGLVIVLLLAAGAVFWSRDDDRAPSVSSHAVGVDVLDGPHHDQRVHVDATVYLPQHTPAPAVIVSPGFGGTKDSVAADATTLAQRGFVVLAYSPRGFGHTTGEIALNSPDYEVADARGLVDWLGRQSEVVKDGPGDPRVGVTGGSYGGALSLLLAGSDKRIDALAPVITYNDLSQSLLPDAAGGQDGVFKRSWAALLFGSGLSGSGGEPTQAQAPDPGQPSTGDQGTTGDTTGGSGTSGSAPQAGQPQQGARQANPCGKFIAEVCAAYQQVATTGTASKATVDLLRRNSPVSVNSRITAPTLIVQGEQDTLFGLDQSDANARQITAAGAKVKTIWYAGGHDGGTPGPALQSEIADWFDFHLAHRGSDPGTGFEYAVQGAFRTSGTPSVREVRASGYPGLTTGSSHSTLPLSGPAQPVLNPPGGAPAAISSLPGLSGGLGAAASRLTTDVPGEFAAFSTAPLAGQLLIAGSPTVRLRVSGAPDAAAGKAVLFAKLYDVNSSGQRTLPASLVAPLRVTLPAGGAPAEVSVTLPGIVRSVAAGHTLQLVVSSTDQAYANAVAPSVTTVSLVPGASGLTVPQVAGTQSSTPVPAPQLIGIVVVLALVVLAWLVARLRRGRSDDVDPALAEVPLVLTGLRKTYGGGIVAVDDLSFTVDRGTVVGLLGPNGAGKTTALRMLMGLVVPTAGEIRVFGRRIRPGAPVLSRIGSFVEGPGFLPHLSGLANLHLYWAATGRPAEQAKFDEALEIAGLGNAVHRKVRTYSQGMRQRLAIAQAMLGLPDLLVLDEPTNGLDPPQIHHMRDVLRRYAATGRTVLVSSHLLAEVEQTCGHVVVMHHGNLVASGTVADIVAGGGETTFTVEPVDKAAGVLRELTGAGAVDVQENVVHVQLNGTPRSRAVDVLVHAGVAVEQVAPRRRLEDAFLQLVGEESSHD